MGHYPYACKKGKVKGEFIRKIRVEKRDGQTDTVENITCIATINFR